MKKQEGMNVIEAALLGYLIAIVIIVIVKVYLLLHGVSNG